LKQRREDVPLLVGHLVERFNRLEGKDVAGVSGEVMSRLMEYDFPGNVRELENIIEQAFVLCSGGLIGLAQLPPELRPVSGFERLESDSAKLSSMEKHLIKLTLDRHKGNRKKAARDLGINTSTLFRKIKAFGIETPPSDGRGSRR